MTNALLYVKNVGRSFGYSAIDIFKEYNPQVKSLASGAKDLSSDLYQSISDFKGSISNTESEKGLFGKGRDSFSELKKNLFDDLKSGNWYNKQRIDQVENEVVGSMFGFDDDDFNLDDLDFDMNFNDEDDGKNDDIDLAQTIVSAEKESTNSIISAMDSVGSRSAAAISTASVRSADYIVTSNRQSSKAIYSLNQRGFHQISTGLAAINANMSSLISLGEPLTTHMQNASTFYTKSSEFQNSVINKLDTLIELSSPQKQDIKTRRENTLDSILNDGVIDLSAYFDMVSKNVKDFKDEMMGFVDMFGGPEQIVKMGTSSPMKMVTTGITKLVFPKLLKDSMQSFNNHLESFFGAAIDKLENTSFDGELGSLFDQIKGSLMPKDGFKDKMSTGNYLKGKTDWTGKDQKALREVIPTYLSQMVSALTGGPETRFDYERGKFITIAGIKKEHENKMKRMAQSAGGDFRQDALAVAANMGLDPETQKKMQDQIEDFFLNMFKTGRGKIMDLNNDDFDYKSYGLDDDSVNILRDVLKSYARLGKTDKANRAATEIRLQRDRYGNDLRYDEANGNIRTTLFDNSSVINKGDKNNKVNPGGIIGVDKYNHDIFFYLQGIYQFTGHLSDNIVLMGTGGSVNPGNGSGGPTPLRDIPYETTDQDDETVSQQNTNTQYNSSTGNSPTRSIDEIIYERHEFEEGSNVRKGERTLNRANKKKEERSKLDADRDAGLISEEEYQEKIRELEEETNNGMGSIFDRLRERGRSNEQLSGVRKILDKVQGIFNKPAEVIADILSAGEISLYHLLYGKDADDEKGLFAYFFEKANNIFDKFDSFLEDKFSFSIKEWAKKLFHKAGESSFVGDVRDEFGNVARNVRNDFSNILGFGSNSNNEDNGEGETEPLNNGQAALGRKVTKTGIVAVSEGEMIIPSDFNPHYHGTNDKATQLRNESRAIGKFFGRYAYGGIIDDNGNEATSETVRNMGSAEDYTSYWDNLVYRDDGTVNTGRSNRNRRIEDARGSRNVRDFISGSAAQLYNGIEDILQRLRPERGESNIIDRLISEENQKRLREANIPDEVAKNRGAVGAGAVIGAGASILTGVLVGPIAGAAIGAGVGLVIRSEKVQKALFGEVNEETGEREGGILSKKISNFIVDQVPSIGKGAGYGAIGGLFLGSPILGAIVGGTVGYISSSEKAKAALFGKQNEDGTWSEGFIKKSLQDKIKQTLPNIGAGMLAGMIAGPFGIVGNLVVGGALGYATTTDKFKDMILGEAGEDGKRHGGVVGDIRTYFFGKKEDGDKQGVFVSINGIFHKLANEVRIHARNIFKDTTKTIRKIISKGAKSTLGQFIATTPIGKAAKWVGEKAVNVAKSPFKMVRGGLEGIDTALGRRALKRGYGLTGKDGKKMTAQERLNQRETYGMNTLARFNLNREYRSNRNLDEYLAGASEDQLNELKTVMQYYEDPTKKYDNDELKAKKDFAKKLEEYGVDAETAVKLERMAVGKGHRGNIDEILADTNLSEDQASDLRSIFGDIRAAQDGRVDAKKDAKAFRRNMLQTNGIFRTLNMKGIDINNDSDIRNIIDLINTESDARFNKTDEEKEQERQEQREDENNENLSTIAEVVTSLYEHITGRSDFSERVPRTSQTQLQEIQDSGEGQTEPIPDGSDVAAVSEGEIILDPTGGRRSLTRRALDVANDTFLDRTRDVVKSGIRGARSGLRTAGNITSSAFNRVRRGYHRLIGSFAEGGIVGGEDVLKGVNEDSAIVTDRANIYVLADRGGTIQGLDNESTNPARSAIETARDVTSEGGSDSGLSDEREDIVTQTDAFGNIYQMRRNEQGELQMDETDSQTQQAMDSQNKLKEALCSIPLIGSAIGGLGGLLGSLRNGLLGDKESGKEGLLSNLLGGLIGDNGVLSGLFSFITDSKIGTSVKSVLGKVGLKSVFSNLVAPALLLGGFGGKFDGIAEQLTNGAYGKGSSTDEKTATVINANGEKVTVTETTDENGNKIWVDSEGNIYDQSQLTDVNVRKTSPDSLSDKLKQNTVRGVLTNTKSVASVVLDNTGVGKKIASGAKAIATSIGDDAVAIAARNNLCDTVIDACTKFTSMLRKIPALSGVADRLDDMGLALAEKISTALGSQSAKKVAEFAKNAVIWAKVAFIVIDFTTGYEDARTTLGIVDEPTVGQKVISGLLRAIKNFIPIIGTLIPDSLVIDVFCEYIAPAFGISADELMDQREKAQETINEWNATHEDNQVSSVGEYNKKILKDYTWSERLGNAAKSTWEDTKIKTSNMVNGIKEKGIGGYLKDSISDMGSSFIDSYKENGGGISGTFNAIGDTFKNLLPGVLGDIAKANSDITAFATKGELGNLWSVSLPDFSGGETTEDGITTAVPGIFSKVIGQIPLILTKLTSTPIALVSGLFGKIKDFFGSDTFGSFVKGADDLLGISSIIEKSKAGDLAGVWSYSAADDEDNGFMKIAKTVPSTVTKVALTVPTIFTAVGNKVKEFVGGLIDKVKSNVGAVATDYMALKTIADTGNLSGLWNQEATEVEGSPVNAFTKAAHVASKISLTPNATFHLVGNKVKEFVGGLINKVKSNVGAVATDYMALHDTAMAGDVGGLWNQEATEVEGSPVNAFTKAAHVASKISLTPNAIFHLVGNKVKEFVGGLINKVRTNVGAVATDYAALHDTAMAGDVGGLWNQEATEVEGSPVNAFTKAAHVASKISLTPNAIFHLVGNKVKDFIENVSSKIKANVSAIGENYLAVKDFADSGDVKGVWSYDGTEDEESPMNAFVKASLFAIKISFTPNAIFHYIGGKINDFISPKVEAVKTDYSTLSTVGDNMKKYAGEGDVSGVWNTKKPEFSKDNVLKPIYGVMFNIQKVFYSLSAVVQKIFGPIKEVIDAAKEKFGGIVDGSAGFVDGVKDKVGNAIDNVADAANNTWQGFKNWVSGGNSGLPRNKRRRYIGAGSRQNEMFVSQMNKNYADIPFGNSTISDVGCAPATATMLANFNKPGSINMNDAIREAAKYDQGNGTSADYFGAVLKKRGMSSNYIDTTASKGKKDLISDLTNGRPAVLLGEDSYNDSKETSPFGPNSHYVMAKGFDKSGNIIINDPESDKPDMVYNPSILDRVNLAVTTDQVAEEDTDAMLDYTKKFGEVVGAGGVPDNNISKNIWGFFTKNGFSPAATAGILGNIYQESSVNPSLIQGGGKGPAAGLFQWEDYNKKSSRWLAMNNYAAKKGKKWTDLNSQLEFALTEINSNDINNRLSTNHSIKDMDGKTYSIPAIGGIKAFKKASDPVAAMQQFEAAFERAGKPNFARRATAAKEYYNLYSGSKYTGSYDSSVGGENGGTSYGDNGSSVGATGGSDTSSTGGILSSITNAFSKGIGTIFGENDTSGTESSVSSSGEDGSSNSTVSAASTPKGQGTAQSFIDIAKSQLGVVEKHDNITPYGKFTGTDGQAWCAAFVSWCMDQAFNHNTKKRNKALRGNISAAVSGLWDNFKRAGAMSKTPQPGDIVIYKNGSSHTGLVETVNGDNITTIEGNTSGGNGFERNGGMVARKNFNYKQHSKLTGFGRPDWDGAASMKGSGSGLLDKLDKASAVARSIKESKHIERPKKPINVFKENVGGKSSLSKDNTQSEKTTSVDPSVINALKVLIKLVQNISDNTSNIPSVGTVLTNYCEAKLTTDVNEAKVNITESTKENSNKISPEDDPALQEIMNTLGAIATG